MGPSRRNFRSNVDYTALIPQGIVFCQETRDVQNAIRWCRENGVALRVRSGRHSYEAYSLLSDGLVIDVGDLDEISVDSKAATARIGAAVFCLDLHEQLFDVGLTVPVASGASVGFAVLTLGAGLV
jgi:FAD/FMN-containing dehydrogenase